MPVSFHIYFYRGQKTFCKQKSNMGVKLWEQQKTMNTYEGNLLQFMGNCPAVQLLYHISASLETADQRL